MAGRVPTESQIEPWFAARVPRACIRPAESGVGSEENDVAEEENCPALPRGGDRRTAE